MIHIVLLGPPFGKERVKRGAAGHAYTPERTVTFESRLAYAAQQVMGDRPPLEGPLDLDVIVRFPIPASKPKKWKEAALAGHIRPTVKPDWDNSGKLSDSLNMIVWVDDKQIVDGRVRKYYSEKPGMWITVKPTFEEEDVFS